MLKPVMQVFARSLQSGQLNFLKLLAIHAKANTLCFKLEYCCHSGFLEIGQSFSCRLNCLLKLVCVVSTCLDHLLCLPVFPEGWSNARETTIYWAQLIQTSVQDLNHCIQVHSCGLVADILLKRLLKPTTL